jgi:PAS domain S-box-containing protein
MTTSSRQSSPAASVFRAVVDTTPDAIAIQVEGQIVYANPAMVALLGARDEAALLDSCLMDFVAPEYRAIVAARAERLRAGEANPLIQERFVALDGTLRDVEVAATPVEIDGRRGGAIIVRDISARLAAERRALATQQHAELVSRATNDAVWDWSVVSGRVSWNRSLHTLFGWDVENVNIDWWIERIHPEDRERVHASIRAIVEGKEIFWSDEYRFQCGDGSIAWILDRGYVVRNDGGEAVRMVGAMTDVSELHRVHEERASLQNMLEQSQRVASLGRVAATIAHEFNNVLMAIQPYAEILRRRSADLPEVERPASQIIQAVRRGKRVTEEILRFTKPAEPILIELNLRDFLKQIAEAIREVAMPQIQVNIEPPTDDIFIRGDLAQLEQVAMNLIINARDAMPHGGTLSIRASATVNVDAPFLSDEELEGYACVSVGDTGDGIPPDLVNKIFEPLFTTKPRGGTGLGLAVAQQIMTGHNGYIVVRSAPGVGTLFHLLLPKSSSY